MIKNKIELVVPDVHNRHQISNSIKQRKIVYDIGRKTVDMHSVTKNPEIVVVRYRVFKLSPIPVTNSLFQRLRQRA
jgi:hypothetical protein